MDMSIVDLFNWSDNTTPASVKKDIVEWYNSLSTLEQSYIEILRENARLDEHDEYEDEDL